MVKLRIGLKVTWWTCGIGAGVKSRRQSRVGVRATPGGVSASRKTAPARRVHMRNATGPDRGEARRLSSRPGSDAEAQRIRDAWKRSSSGEGAFNGATAAAKERMPEKA